MTTAPSSWGRSIRDHYPAPKDWRSNYQPDWDVDIFRYTRLWLTEGIPFAFRDQPIVFEYAREKLATMLGEFSRDVGMTGSARSGHSFNPKKFGEKYERSRSDLDVFVVSKRWLELLASDFSLFSERYQKGEAVARNDKEAGFFEANFKETPNTIKRGFIDQWRIPSANRYTHAKTLRLAAELFRKTLNSEMAEGAYINRVSIRVYSDWQRAVGQIGGSLLKSIRDNA